MERRPSCKVQRSVFPWRERPSVRHACGKSKETEGGFSLSVQVIAVLDNQFEATGRLSSFFGPITWFQSAIMLVCFGIRC